jgi:hypothetical protein
VALRRPYTRRIPKSAKTGKVVTLAYALSHPATTFIDSVIVRPKKKRKN